MTLPPAPAACSWCGVDNQRSDCIDGMVPTDEYLARCPNRPPPERCGESVGEVSLADRKLPVTCDLPSGHEGAHTGTRTWCE